MDKIGEILTRMKELATQAASGNVGTDIAKLSDEYNALVEEIDRIAQSTKYAGTQLLTGGFNAGNTSDDLDAIDNVYNASFANATAGDYDMAYAAGELSITFGGITETKTLADGAQTVSFSTLGISFSTTSAATADGIGGDLDGLTVTVDEGGASAFQVGYSAAAYDRLSISLTDVQAAALGVAADDIATSADAQTTLGTIEDAISALASARSIVGAYQNRLGYASSNVAITVENFQAAESVIRDVDMAAEMTTFTKNQILLQAGTAMLAQANMAPQQILALFS